MTNCSYCRNHIFMGGIQNYGLWFCNKTCQQNACLVAAKTQVSDDDLWRSASLVHQGRCPRCDRGGPIDVHKSHYVVSIIFLTYWSSKSNVCCRRCGRNEQITNSLISLLFGWWGLPFGVVMTPVQIFRNLSGLLSGPEPSKPSNELYRLIQISVGERALKSRQLGQR
jgi:hypothetical protein